MLSLLSGGASGGGARERFASGDPIGIPAPYDIRGMGESVVLADGGAFEPGEDATHLDSLPLDVAAAVEFLGERREVDPRRIAVVGASVGANIAYVGAAPISTCAGPSPSPPWSRGGRWRDGWFPVAGHQRRRSSWSAATAARIRVPCTTCW